MKSMIELKAQMLCEGVNADADTEKLFRQQNPSNVKRGGLSSGGKMRLAGSLFVNVPFYRKRETSLKLIADPSRDRGVLIQEGGRTLCEADVLPAPDWYGEKVGSFEITQIFTAHNRQLACAVYEDCALFHQGEGECRFCVMNRSLENKCLGLIRKDERLILAALKKIPVHEYGGITMNGGMTVGPDRGMKYLARATNWVSASYPSLPIAVEITPPEDLAWIDMLCRCGVSSLMMNLECWGLQARKQLIPGKNKYCPRDMYLRAFERALKVFGPGRVSTCFVVGTESLRSLKEGIRKVVSMGVVPSPLAGRFFEDIPNYPFAPNVNWREFLEILQFTEAEMARQGVATSDKAGCVACGMCDMIRDKTR